MTEQVIERVARAIDSGWWAWFDQHGRLDFPTDAESHHRSLERARAAISALSTLPADEGLREALTFYAEAWEQDVDAERTPSGWVGNIGEIEPSTELLADKGAKARAALSSTLPSGDPVAWRFELAQSRVYEDNKPVGWTDWGKPQLSFTKPCVPEGSIRNLTPLYATSGPEPK